MTAPQHVELLERRLGPVTAQDMALMAEVLQDPNPIHLDVEAVKAMALGDRLINQGPTNLGYVIDMLQANFPDRRLNRLRARFLSNVCDGDEVVAGGRVDEAGAGGMIECTVWLDVIGGNRAIEGTATLTPAV